MKSLDLQGLIRDLRNNGFFIGIETYEEIYRVLAPLQEWELYYVENVKERLITLLCKSEEQVAVFEAVFNNNLIGLENPYIADARLRPQTKTGEEVSFTNTATKQQVTKEEKKEKKPIFNLQNPWRVAFIIASVITLGLAYYLFVVKPLDQAVLPAETNPTEKIISPNKIDIKPHESLATGNKRNNGSKQKRNSIQSETDKLIRLIEPDVERFVIKDFAKFNYGRLANYLYIFLFLIAVIFFVFSEIARNLKKRMVFKNRANLKSMLAWPIQFNFSQNIYVHDDYYQLANQLNMARGKDYGAMDIKKTINATMKNAGFVTFVKQDVSKKARYLFLIEQDSVNNHFTVLHKFMINFFAANDVKTVKYYFDRDAGIYWNERHNKEVSLKYLSDHYGDYTLVIIGLGLRFIDQQTGQLHTFTKQFKTWETRVLMSTSPVESRAFEDKALKKMFTLLPSGLNGFKNLARLINHEPLVISNEPAFNALNNNEIIERIRKYDELNQRDIPIMKWVAGCCLYPKLNWSITIFIGNTLSTHTSKLCTPENLDFLCRIPWFLNGKIPDEVRASILNSSAAPSTKERKAIADGFRKVLEQNKPDNEDTYAAKEHQFYLLLSKAISSGKERGALERIKKLVSDFNSFDDVLLNHVHTLFPTKLDLVLPRKFRLGFLENFWLGKVVGIPLRFIALMFGLALLFIQIDPEVKHYDLEVNDSKVYLLDSIYKKSAFLCTKAAFFYNETPTNSLCISQAETFIDSALSCDENFWPAVVNRAILNKNLEIPNSTEIEEKLKAYSQWDKEDIGGADHTSIINLINLLLDESVPEEAAEGQDEEEEVPDTSINNNP